LGFFVFWPIRFVLQIFCDDILSSQKKTRCKIKYRPTLTTPSMNHNNLIWQELCVLTVDIEIQYITYLLMLLSISFRHLIFIPSGLLKIFFTDVLLFVSLLEFQHSIDILVKHICKEFINRKMQFEWSIC